MRLLLTLLSLAALACADQVILKNGDTITGSIVKKDGGKLTIKSEFLGEVTMPWTAVKGIRSDEPLTVELPGGRLVAGKISTAGETLEVATPSGVQPAPLTQVGAVRNAAEQHTFERLQHPRLLELWTGFFDTGLALARGNAHTDTLTTNFNATRITRKDKITINFGQIYGTARLNNVNSAVASALHGSWTYDRDMTPRFFVATLNSYEHDRFQNLDLRFVAGGGFGWNALKSDRANLSFTGGGDYEREAFMAAPTRTSGEANITDTFLYKFSATTNLTESFQFFPNLSYTGQYRMNFDVSAVTAVRKWLGWHVTASDRYLSNPVLGRLKNDLVLSTGLRLTFAK